MLNTDECKMQNEVAAKTCFLTKIAYSEIQNFKFRQVRWCIAQNGPQIKQRRLLIIRMKHKMFYIIIKLFI